MERSPKVAVAALVCFVWTCHNTTLQISHTKEFDIPAQNEIPNEEFKQGGLLAGLIETFSSPEAKCASGKPLIQIRRDFMDNLIHWTIGGVYTRRTVRIFCKK
ncbi:hypothetical protein EHQ12_16775 [Leptospira gomenensis]|uniref:Uncharacterized protein n=1 Tax=Leptospira gomenensis TaxID=2484974 RepID=A0A5F1YEC1_9LEPT|nr:hypothetical protein EHQ12_16775 [Leptospira gomenensis]TGK37319.1 hypothetical protein EHQ17_03485 [Leptospira gomenensis]TGK51107.1 hypothetical protein EHQ07_03550 [Leptospira gomenensis]TGK56636.1 hypothetical protein EHQ13_15475 [Leptospira gomenensis]